MADEPQVIRGIDWKATFPFTQIFKSFRIAVHPSKLVLALLALLAIYFGGRLMDGLWGRNSRAVPDEIGLYERNLDASDGAAAFQRERKAKLQSTWEAYRGELERLGKKDGDLGDAKAKILEDRDAAVKAANEAYDKSSKDDAAALARQTAIREAHERATGRYRTIQRNAQLEGPFQQFLEYEIRQFYGVVNGVTSWDWLGSRGVVQSIYRFFAVGPVWALRHHPLFFTIFLLYFLVVWSVFGGAISRIAAVHFARDEKISIRQALRFSTSKFLSFLSAPIIPLLIIVLVGLIVAVGGLITNIPFIGPIVVGLLFFLALAAGVVMTLVLIGLVGGCNLMYPTIAAEGSDSFDAISRSFSYLYARPWRLLFYTFVAIVYGALTYLFVRLFVWVALMLTHAFAGMWVFADAPNAAPLWPMLWPAPTWETLPYDLDFLALNVGQDIGATLIAIWVYLMISLLGAYAISFYFSANSVIYFLMRHEVDATELDDVYLETSEDEFAETPTVPATAASPAPETTTTGAAPGSTTPPTVIGGPPATSAPPPETTGTGEPPAGNP